jgi:quinol-cytochrome oxidoreductase complex cytochrome b subunit
MLYTKKDKGSPYFPYCNTNKIWITFVVCVLLFVFCYLIINDSSYTDPDSQLPPAAIVYSVQRPACAPFQSPDECDV